MVNGILKLKNIFNFPENIALADNVTEASVASALPTSKSIAIPSEEGAPSNHAKPILATSELLVDAHLQIPPVASAIDFKQSLASDVESCATTLAVSNATRINDSKNCMFAPVPLTFQATSSEAAERSQVICISEGPRSN